MEENTTVLRATAGTTSKDDTYTLQHDGPTSKSS